MKHFALLLLILAVVGCGGRGANAPVAAAWTPYSIPGDETCQLLFPGKPDWVDEPFTVVDARTGKVVQQSTLRLFKYEDPRTGNSFSVRSYDRFESLMTTSDEELTRWAVDQFAFLVKDGQRGPVTNGVFGGLIGAECVVTVPTTGKTFAFRAMTESGKIYEMVVYGPTAGPGNPDTATFFDSFRLQTRGPLPSNPAPTDDLRPLAKIPHFTAGGFAGSGTFVAVRDQHVSGGQGYTLTKAARYQYPTFRPDGEFVIDRPIGPVAVDGPRALIYSAYREVEKLPPDPNKPGSINLRSWYWLAAYPVPACGTPLPTKTTPSPHRSVPSYPIAEPQAKARFDVDHEPRLVTPSADGRHVFVAASRKENQSPVRLLRLAAATLAAGTEIELENPIAVLRESADEQTVYAICYGYKMTDQIDSWRAGGVVHEVDRVTWSVRRSTRIAATPFGAANGPGKSLWITAREQPRGTHNDPTHIRMTVLDLGADPPRQRVLGTYPPRLFVTAYLDRSRAYFYGPRMLDYDVASWDARAALDGWTRVIKSHTARVTDHRVDYPSWVAPILSPDGKCLVLGNGRACWLAGAGEPPAVDPAAAWTKW